MKEKLHFNSLLILIFFVVIQLKVNAQTLVLPEGAVLCSFNYGLGYAGITGFKQQRDFSGYNPGQVSSSIQKKYFNPINFCIEYGYRNNMAFGIVGSYTTYNLVETRTVPLDKTIFKIKGKKVVIQFKALRYFAHTNKSMLYLFTNIGIKMVKNTYSSTDEYTVKSSNLFLYPAIKDKYNLLNAELGIGYKYLLSNHFAIGIEGGAINSIVQVGISYRFINKYRITKDLIGW